MLRAGDQVGPYSLIHELGRGGFGVVWLAERRTPMVTTKVALKVPLNDTIDVDTVREEATLWVQASGHPNVLPIIEANIYDGQVVIVSEYASDGSLDAWLEQYGSKTPSTESAVAMISGILTGLKHLHARRIIHRDLKLANILLQGQIPRLADFGISRLWKSKTQSRTIAGTPEYMAPEAFDGKRSEQTDVWSVGVIFYQLLTGRLPFPQEDHWALMGAIIMREPEPLPPSVPTGLQEVVARALHKDTAQRYQSAAEMLSALASNESVVSPPLGATQARKVYLTRSEKLTDTPAPRRSAGNAVEPEYVAGTEFEYVRRDEEGYFLVKNTSNNELWLSPYGSTTEDPRTYFRIKERGIIGYLVGTMHYRTKHFANTTYINVFDPLLGKAEIQIRRIKSIRVIVENKEASLEVETLDGNQYTGTSEDHSIPGHTTNTYLICTDINIPLENVEKNITLEAVQDEEKHDE